jgi:hypothetical protein
VDQKKTPWLALSLGTFGLVVGYATVVLTGPVALANGRSCPLKTARHEACTGTGCLHGDDCAMGECGKDCPGCAHHG